MAGGAYAIVLSGLWVLVSIFAAVVTHGGIPLPGEHPGRFRVEPGSRGDLRGLRLGSGIALVRNGHRLIVLPLTYVLPRYDAPRRRGLAWRSLGRPRRISGGCSSLDECCVFFLRDGVGNFGNLLIVLAVGPGLATIFGQIGGAWGRRVSPSRENGSAKRPCVRRSTFPAGSEVEPSQREEATAAEHRPWFQFGISTLLWVAVWISLLLSVIRLSGFDLAIASPILLAWLVFQAATLWASSR